MTLVQGRQSVVASSIDRRRYPGVRSFQEEDAGRFFGRRRATEELLLRVLSVRLLLQFAPSGAGKTSLLNAGLFPRLRPHGYFPFAIRLNQSDETLVQAVTRSLRDAARNGRLNDPVIPDSAESVWAFLAGTQLWSADLLLLTPVLVFDQFEEVFTLRDEAFRKSFALEIGELSRGQHVGTPADKGGGAAPDAKIVISLREEYLGALEEMSAAIPDLFRERLRLSPLTADEAKVAIVEPAKLDGDWLSPKFGFTDECLAGLIDFIDGASERIRVIEPLTLQLVCQKAESIATTQSAQAPVPELVLADFGGPLGLERLVHNYYTSELDKLASRTARRRAVVMFEQGLLDPSGKRLMLEQGEIHRRYGLDESVLSALLNSRLLRREPRSESVFYEISHDRLTDAIARHRTVRLPKWVLPALAAAVVLIALLSAFLLYIILLKRRADEAQRNTAEALHVLFGDVLVTRLRESGLSDTLEQVLKGVQIDGASDPLARALQLRRLGELAFERDTLGNAGQKFTEALAVLDRAAAAGERGVAIDAERAQVLRALGDVLRDKGEVSAAKSTYTDAVRLWNDVLKRENTPTNQLNAVEARTSLASLSERVGDVEGPEAEFADAAHEALGVLKDTYHQMANEGSDDAFALGRAMQLYADAALSFARVWGVSDDLKGARALAAELLRLRPLSAQARIQLGTASAVYGNLVAGEKEWQQARPLLDEASKQFSEVTRFDPRNRRMSREVAAVKVVTADGKTRCAAQADCRKTLRPGELDVAEKWILDAIGKFQELSAHDRENHAFLDDIAWGKENQVNLKRARNAPDGAIELLDEALDLRRRAIADAADITTRVGVIDLLQNKAIFLTEAGRRDEALKVIDESLAAAQQLPASVWQTSRRNSGMLLKANTLDLLGRKLEAATLRGQLTKLEEARGKPEDVRRNRALQLNKEAIALYAQAGKVSGPEKGPAFERAAQKYQEAITQYLFYPTIWSNLRMACSEAATAWSNGDATTQPKEEAALRCALESAWMAWVLRADADPSPDGIKKLKTLYTDRRGLALFLRNDAKRVPQALRLAEEGVREAETLALQDPSADTLFLLADAYYGLGLMREESKREGWEQAIRAAIADAERLRDLEPTNAAHRIWIGQVRTELANRLESRKRPGAASERELARRTCQDALRLATKPGDRSEAQACIDATQTKAAVSR